MRKITNIIMIAIGCVLMAIGTVFFLLPNKLSSGGFTGIGTVIYYIFHFNIGTTIILLNIPLFIMTYIKFGKSSFIRAIIGTAMLSIFLNFFENISENVKVITNDKLLASIYGGLIVGVGTGIVVKYGASTGGTELLCKIISKIFPQFKVSQMIIIFDVIIVGVNVLTLKQIEIGLYSAVAIYIIGKMLEIIAEGTHYTKMIFIVSEKYNEIAKEISSSLARGSTAIYAQGMYKNEDKKILWCVASRNEIVKIRQIASKIDEKSFMTILAAREAYGLGFKED